MDTIMSERPNASDPQTWQARQGSSGDHYTWEGEAQRITSLCERDVRPGPQSPIQDIQIHVFKYVDKKITITHGQNWHG